MKGDAKVVAQLNAVLTNELTAINQYFVHAKMFEHWGLERLAEHVRKESIDEMRHADEPRSSASCFSRACPTFRIMHKLLVGEDVKEALDCDLKLEMTAHPVLKAAIAECEKAATT